MYWSVAVVGVHFSLQPFHGLLSTVSSLLSTVRESDDSHYTLLCLLETGSIATLCMCACVSACVRLAVGKFF